MASLQWCAWHRLQGRRDGFSFDYFPIGFEIGKIRTSRAVVSRKGVKGIDVFYLLDLLLDEKQPFPLKMAISQIFDRKILPLAWRWHHLSRLSLCFDDRGREIGRRRDQRRRIKAEPKNDQN